MTETRGEKKEKRTYSLNGELTKKETNKTEETDNQDEFNVVQTCRQTDTDNQDEFNVIQTCRQTKR